MYEFARFDPSCRLWTPKKTKNRSSSKPKQKVRELPIPSNRSRGHLSCCIVGFLRSLNNLGVWPILLFFDPIVQDSTCKFHLKIHKGTNGPDQIRIFSNRNSENPVKNQTISTKSYAAGLNSQNSMRVRSLK